MSIVSRETVTDALRRALKLSPDGAGAVAAVAQSLALPTDTVAECMPTCAGCGRQLQGDEVHYYGMTCETCEASSLLRARLEIENARG